MELLFSVFPVAVCVCAGQFYLSTVQGAKGLAPSTVVEAEFDENHARIYPVLHRGYLAVFTAEGGLGLKKRVRSQEKRPTVTWSTRAVSDELVSGNKSIGSFQRLAAKVLEITTVPIVR